MEKPHVNSHCEDCKNFKNIKIGQRGGKSGYCKIRRPAEKRSGRERACKYFEN